MSRHKLILPELGLAGQSICMGLWLVDLGRDVAHGQPLVEILAGAAVVDLPSPADGRLIEKLVDEDTVVDVVGSRRNRVGRLSFRCVCLIRGVAKLIIMVVCNVNLPPNLELP